MAKWTPEELNNYRTQAEAGDIDSQTYLGRAYFEGKFVEKNEDIGRAWLERAIGLGSKEASYRLALFLISRNDRDGVGMLAELSAESYAPAAYELGNCYYAGFLVERNAATAVQQWSNAVDNGHALAKIKLLKYQSLRAPFYRKPLFFIRIAAALISTSSVMMKDLNDQRVLGSLK